MRIPNFIRQLFSTDVTEPDPPKAPHQIYPEILEWKVGDEFRGGTVHCERLVSISADGYGVIKFCDNVRIVPLSRLVGRNASAQTRRINTYMHDSHEYMDLLKAFNESVDELRERDKRLQARN